VAADSRKPWLAGRGLLRFAQSSTTNSFTLAEQSGNAVPDAGVRLTVIADTLLTV